VLYAGGVPLVQRGELLLDLTVSQRGCIFNSVRAKHTIVMIMLVSLACILIGGVGLGAALVHIRRSVNHFCEIARQWHPNAGDDVSALIEYMNSEEHSLSERNKAVWTLGRLRAKAALPSLQAAYTGQPCEHEKCLCQRELQRAIKRCGGVPKPAGKAGH